MNDTFYRYAGAVAGGLMTSVLLPSLPYIALCTAFVLADVVTAYNLSRRVRRDYGEAARFAQAGKLQSRRLGRTVITLLRIYVLLLAAASVDALFPHLGRFTAMHYAAGIVLVWQGLSIVENVTSCNPSPWARRLSRYVHDKVSRHLMP